MTIFTLFLSIWCPSRARLIEKSEAKLETDRKRRRFATYVFSLFIKYMNEDRSKSLITNGDDTFIVDTLSLSIY